MTIAILGAMDKELNLLLSIMPNHEKIHANGLIYYKGVISGKDVIVGKCGIGKVNAAINTYRFIQACNPDIVINSGVAGGGSSKVKIGDVLIADRVSYHDVWCGPGTQHGTADGFSQFFIPSREIVDETRKRGIANVFGLICSGDKFIHEGEEVVRIKEKFPDVMAVDMESAAIAQTCEMCNVPFLIVRVLSDTPGSGDNISQYNDFWGAAPRKTFECVKKIITDIF